MHDEHSLLSSQRRALLKGALALTPLLICPASAQDAPPEADSKPPQPGDRLVFISGPKKGEPIRIDDLVLGGPQVQAYPADPSGVVRDGRKFNLIILTRVGDEGLSEETRARSASGVVAYTGICTHQACPVNMWMEDEKALICSCHGSVYDPKNDANVVSGPAPRNLPALPLKSDNGLLLVAGGFTGRVGGDIK